MATAGETTHSAEWRRTLVIELDDVSIADLAIDLANTLGVEFDVADLSPHISLAYRDDLGEEGRSRLATEVDALGQPLTFDALAVMHSEGDVGRVDMWRVSRDVALGGGSATVG